LKFDIQIQRGLAQITKSLLRPEMWESFTINGVLVQSCEHVRQTSWVISFCQDVNETVRSRPRPRITRPRRYKTFLIAALLTQTILVNNDSSNKLWFA